MALTMRLLGLAVSHRDRRALGLGLVTLVLVGGAGRGIPAWQRWEESARTTSERVTAELAIMEANVRQLPTLRDSAGMRWQRLAALTPLVIEAPSPAEAGAILGAHLAEIAEQSRVKVTSMVIRPDSLFRGGVARAGVRLHAMADVAGLTALLARIEGGELLLAVRELAISQPEPAAADETPEALRVEMVIEALTLQAGPRPR